MRVNIYHDGKLSRAIKAKHLLSSGKGILIEFYDDISEVTVTANFKKVGRDYKGVYHHWPTNTWFYRLRETAQFKAECKDWFTTEYWEEYFQY